MQNGAYLIGLFAYLNVTCRKTDDTKKIVLKVCKIWPADFMSKISIYCVVEMSAEVSMLMS